MLMDYPICAKKPAIRKLHHCDIDEQAARLTGYDQSYQQISRGAFSGTFVSCDIDAELSLFFENTNQVLYQSATVPRDHYAVGLLMNTDKTLVFNCSPFTKGAAFILPPGAEMQGNSSPAMTICVIHVACALLQQALERQTRAGRHFSPEYIPYKMVTNTLDTRSLYSLLKGFLHGAAQEQLSFNSANQTTAFKNTLVETIGSLFVENPGSGLIKARDKHLRLFHHALDIIQDNLCEQLMVGNLCEELAVSRRTLEYIFIENIEMSPAKYIKVLRLNNIRREILSKECDNLGDIAAKWGIWHLGRFSQDYHRLFGELPSATKERVGRR